METTSQQFIFIVDTKEYSGNFERELCAFITGQIGECEVGEGEASYFETDVSEELAKQFEELVMQVQDDDNRCYRPCAIWPTPGRYNNGNGGHFDIVEGDTEKHWPAYESVAIFFEERPTLEMIELMKERAQLYSDELSPITIIGYRLLMRKTISTVDVVQDFNIPI